MAMTHRNHYVTRSYLERFTNKGKVSVYRTLVPHSSVPRWKSYSPDAIAYLKHLYTSVSTGTESDDMERWLAHEIDEPASIVMKKAVAGCRMTSDDWRRLVRFVAAQDLRTPAGFAKFLEVAKMLMQEVLDQSIEDLKRKLQNAQSTPADPQSQGSASRVLQDYLPLRLDVFTFGDTAYLRTEALAGKSLFLQDLKRQLTSTWEILMRHRWKVLRAPPGVSFLTSDNPVMKCNPPDVGTKFGGGWDSAGTTIMMPLSPDCMLYTEVGVRRPMQDQCLTVEQAQSLNRLTAEHAYRAIYSRHPIVHIESFRRRVVNAAQYEQ